MSQCQQRELWLEYLLRLAEPVLGALSQRQLHAVMPLWADNPEEKRPFAGLGAFGRLMAGIAPWLELPDAQGKEGQALARWRAAAVEALDAATDPDSPDYMCFTGQYGNQPLAAGSSLALGLLRAPRLWEVLNSRVQQQIIESLRQTRAIQPWANNWLLFSATIEAFFCRIGEPFDRMRVDYALRQHEGWYLGDGIYGDGAHFHWDYYNSLVIHPRLLATLDVVGEQFSDWEKMRLAHRLRSQRYAVQLERLIATDGSFPPIGRSITARAGVFHLLGLMALRHDLPEQLQPGQVREALTRVLRRTLDVPGTFDENGWLQPGLCGHQPSLAERYIYTGSLYSCAAALLPLGLPADDAFWTEPGVPTCDRAWSGQDLPSDRFQD